MSLASRIKIAILALLGAALVTVGPAWVGYQVARGDGPVYVVDATDPLPSSHPYRDTLIAQAETGSAAALPSADAGAPDTVSPIGAPLDELAALKAKYDALKAAKSGGGSKDLVWFAYAALVATLLRVLLAAVNTYRGDKPKAWAKWTALGLAVPIYLLTYYAAGAGLWPAIVMAGAGPGAIVVNELLKRKASS